MTPDHPTHDALALFFATFCFAAAIAHTFLVNRIQRMASRFPEGSVGENLLHLLGEVEVVFGIWAGIYLFFLLLRSGSAPAITELESRNFTEPGFVFVIMVMSATRPVLSLAGAMISRVAAAFARLLRIPAATSFYWSCLVIGPLLGAWITEPAAMTVTALLLHEKFYRAGISDRLKYATLGLLFVSVSIGGTLTPYAAPPVLMVAKLWGWDLQFMLTHFGWKACVAILLATTATTWRHRKELGTLGWNSEATVGGARVPLWISLSHLFFMGLVVLSAHHLVVFAGLFLFFLGLVTVTQEYQDQLKLKEGLLVAFFLGGLVVLGAPQRWWLEPVLTALDDLPLFVGGISLTAITDNAALTYLGAQVPGLAEASRYALVAGAVTGGGLTVIANAPNPAGYGILNPSFGPEGINPLLLFKSALAPTVLAALLFWLLPHY
jgi:hypothetical protein